MGKKRTRVPGEPRAGNKGGDVTDSGVQHRQTLEEDVREQRDVQYATEKREAERNKRRRFVADPDSDNPNSLVTEASPVAVKRADARAAGLEMWRRAAANRKKVASVAASEQKTESKIIEEARIQRAEIRAQDASDKSPQAVSHSFAEDGTLPTGNSASSGMDSDASDADGDDGRESLATTGGIDSDMLDFLDGSKITDEDELALSLFTKAGENAPKTNQNSGPNDEGGDPSAAGSGRLMLVDIILQKIREKEEEDARAAALAADPERAERDRKIAHVYGLVGNIMAKYRSGKVPKAFKVIPKVRNWQHLIYLTRPDEWSPAAMYVATRLLASNLPAKEVVPFYSDILLPRCLEDIAGNKKLNYHLYCALSKAVYKPDAFCKGILFPMCEDKTVTLRQATIISSVVTKVSIPMLHSAAALLYLSQLPFNPTTCLVMTALIEKKYALPFRVVDSVVESFVGMKEDDRPLPLMWHKCLLAFVQRYKTELTSEQKEMIKRLVRVHTHHAITPEVRREMFSAKNRGDVVEPDANTIAKKIAEAAMIE